MVDRERRRRDSKWVNALSGTAAPLTSLTAGRVASSRGLPTACRARVLRLSRDHALPVRDGRPCVAAELERT